MSVLERWVCKLVSSVTQAKMMTLPSPIRAA